MKVPEGWRFECQDQTVHHEGGFSFDFRTYHNLNYESAHELKKGLNSDLALRLIANEALAKGLKGEVTARFTFDQVWSVAVKSFPHETVLCRHFHAEDGWRLERIDPETWFVIHESGLSFRATEKTFRTLFIGAIEVGVEALNEAIEAIEPKVTGLRIVKIVTTVNEDYSYRAELLPDPWPTVAYL